MKFNATFNQFLREIGNWSIWYYVKYDICSVFFILKLLIYTTKYLYGTHIYSVECNVQNIDNWFPVTN
jgi:hypothetical protein